jgi:hypothetical protein
MRNGSTDILVIGAFGLCVFIAFAAFMIAHELDRNYACSDRGGVWIDGHCLDVKELR